MGMGDVFVFEPEKKAKALFDDPLFGTKTNCKGTQPERKKMASIPEIVKMVDL